MNAKREESEKVIEAYLVRMAKAHGGMALKYYNGTDTGYPDRIVILPGRPAFWVELKSKGKKLRPMQSVCGARLSRLGQHVYIADSMERVDEILAMENDEVQTL